MIAINDLASPRPQLVEATVQDEATLANLLELYVHDFSEFHSMAIGPDGRYGYPTLSLYWREPGRYPFLVKLGESLAGFVLVQKCSQISGSGSIWDLAEFFVLRGFRRRGIGSDIARAVWTRFPGSWEVRVMRCNSAAYQFWQRAILQFTHESRSFEHAGKNGEIVHFIAFEAR
jgi:predicted acetyltransferase